MAPPKRTPTQQLTLEGCAARRAQSLLVHETPDVVRRVVVQLLADWNVAFNAVERSAALNWIMRKLTGDPEFCMSRQLASTLTATMATESEAAFLANKKKQQDALRRIAHLAVDSGTVHRRWVAFMLHLPGEHPLVYRLWTDDQITAEFMAQIAAMENTNNDDDGDQADLRIPAALNVQPPGADVEFDLERGRLTTVRLQAACRSICDQLLRDHRIFVVGVTTDNARNRHIAQMSDANRSRRRRAACCTAPPHQRRRRAASKKQKFCGGNGAQVLSYVTVVQVR